MIEAKEPSHGVGDGMQQALDYAEMLGVPFAFSSNGSAFPMHDGTGASKKVETTIKLDAFPSPETLWDRFCAWKKLEKTPMRFRRLFTAFARERQWTVRSRPTSSRSQSMVE